MHKTMRKSAVLKGAVAGIASIAMLMSVSVTANAADTPSYGSAVKPNITSLLGEYYNWWTPKKVVNNTPQGDAFRGKVTDAGKSVLGQNDKTVVAINNKAAADTTKVDGTYTQAERAALDAAAQDLRPGVQQKQQGLVRGLRRHRQRQEGLQLPASVLQQGERRRRPHDRR